MVANNWNDADALKCVQNAGSNVADQELALETYASRLIGSNPELVQHGGGNTSCKVMRTDLFGQEHTVLHVKGSGHDLGQIQADGMPGMWLAPLLQYRALAQLSDEDMVNVMRGNMLNSTGPTPSVEGLLHAFLPHKFINHTHATAMLALCAMPDAKAVTREIFGDKIVTIPFIMPGFELGKAAAEIYESHPDVEGLMLLNHGHFAFAEDAKEAYARIIRHTNMVESWFKAKTGRTPAQPGAAQSNPATAEMLAKAHDILPMLRGIIGTRRAAFSGNIDAAMPVMDLRAGPNVQEFFARDDVAALSRRGVATPDHVIRTKNYPLHLTTEILAGGKAAIAGAVDAYIAEYTHYFDTYSAVSDTPKTMLNPAPDLAWIEGVGVVGMGADAKAAMVASDLAEQNLTAMQNAEACGGFHPVGEPQIFEMEYWSLEQAKLGAKKPPLMAGQVVLITGGAGGIGLACAQAFAAQGANIFLVDHQDDGLNMALSQLGPHHAGLALDITAKGAADRAMQACITRFGGLDILISNAGAAWTGEMSALSDTDLRQSFELNFFAHQAFAKAAAAVFKVQGRGGQILFNVSKQAVNPGKGFGAYGLPKATTMFLLRQLALELGPSGVRVNGINADRIRTGLLDDDFITERAAARGIDERTYMAGNLLGREVEARHVADGFVTLAQSHRTTAHILTVDGGNIEAALR